MTGWIKEREKANKFPWSTRTFFGSLRHFLLEQYIYFKTCHLGGLFDQIESEKKPDEQLQVIGDLSQQIYQW